MTGDKAVFMVSIFALGFLLGLSVSEEKAAVNLQPCPVQSGMKVKSSVSIDGKLTCYYAPSQIPKKI